MLKLLGAGLILCVSLFLGITAGKAERARTAECAAFLELFSYIQNQISYFAAPTKHIYSGLCNEVLEKMGFLSALAAHEKDEIYFDAWGAALADSRKKLHLTNEQYELVRAFGACIGKSNEDLQLKELSYYAKALAAETETQKSEMKKNIKVYRTLGIAVGMAAVILVL